MSSLDPAAAVDLVRRIIAGDGQAETELVERCEGVLRFLARRHSRTEADGEDLYQETVILALEKIRRREVKEPERLSGFLRALVKNLATQRYRRVSYSVERPVAEIPEAPNEHQPDSLDAMMHSERSRLTRRLLGELPVPRDRDVLFRYYIAEQGSRRICCDLGIESEHFYRVLHRARQRYRQLWDARSGAGTGAERGGR